MFWYLIQLFVIYWVVNFYVGLNTHEPFIDILAIAIFAAFAVTWLLTRALWLLSGRAFKSNPLLSQQTADHPRIEVSHDVLPRPAPKYWPSHPWQRLSNGR